MSSDYTIKGETLIFHHEFDISLKNFAIPPNIKKIVFEDYTKGIDPLRKYTNIETIVLSYYFNQRITALPPNLKVLQFGRFYNCSLCKLPDTLETLIFDERYNKPFIHPLPKSLKVLKFEGSSCFNQPLPNLPNSLKLLKLGNDFNQPLSNLSNSLKLLNLGFKFNQPLPNLPNSLKYLRLGNDFNQPLPNLPNSLKSLNLGFNFNQPLPNLPDGLKYLKLSCSFNHYINQLPKSLKVFVNATFYNYIVLPNKLKVLITYYNGSTLNLDNYLPHTITYLHIVFRNKLSDKIYLPKTVKYFKISCIFAMEEIILDNYITYYYLLKLQDHYGFALSHINTNKRIQINLHNNKIRKSKLNDILLGI